MKISVITISFNAEKHIERTIQSVINQTFSDIEYIIIDGASKDKTVDIIKKYDEKITFWQSEPDKGLYNAMNKGIKQAAGEYLIFMNAGDCFSSKDTVTEIFNSSSELQDVYYGETLIVDEQDKEVGMRRLSTPKELTWKSYKRGMRVSHQAFIARVELVDFYDETYKYSSDFDWCINILKKAEKIKNTNLIITRYLDGGLTKQNLVPSLKERFKIMTKYYGLVPTIFNHFVLGTKLLFFMLKNKWF